MPSNYMTPGVYIQEKNAFPNSVVAVETSIAVFIGYTSTATFRGKSLINIPTRIGSFAEYIERFGGGFTPQFTIADAGDADSSVVKINGAKKALRIKNTHTFYLYNSIRLFYANGGGTCYIMPVDTYGDKPDGIAIKADDFIKALPILEKEPEPSVILAPDAIALGVDCYTKVYAAILQHCATMQNRFAIFDLTKQVPGESTDSVVNTFRDEIGTNNLKYGAAYYPWLNTAIIKSDEISFGNLAKEVDLEAILPEVAAKEAVKKFKDIVEPSDKDKADYQKSLEASSATYRLISDEIRSQLNQLPPSAAMTGVYTLVDNTRGVWKAPANVTISAVNSPSVNISNDEQASLNVDVMLGKSINVIRAFPGMGNLVWGARTLDGNSQDWRYINVRRTVVMIEQSIKLAIRSYVFEPNDAATWERVRSIVENFLTNLWKQGALAGATPADAFNVQAGLGATMTPNDILDGTMIVAVKIAIVRPAEFIVLYIRQQVQAS